MGCLRTLERIKSLVVQGFQQVNDSLEGFDFRMCLDLCLKAFELWSKILASGDPGIYLDWWLHPDLSPDCLHTLVKGSNQCSSKRFGYGFDLSGALGFLTKIIWTGRI